MASGTPGDGQWNGRRWPVGRQEMASGTAGDGQWNGRRWLVGWGEAVVGNKETDGQSVSMVDYAQDC